MPYIKKDRRFMLNEGLNTPQNAGELNYNITKMVLAYLDGKEDYQHYNDVLGVLSAVAHELYRRRIGSYENLKIRMNGDVY